ncbi:DUF1918 domain-containing protein [Nocardia sp. GCM10030253]|uniref:DUF1918 domain-containing protein n=1 Tax=Nocardia sp. GCM10030253 TaxID=3273404 RepID=UPI003629BFF0
MNGCRLVTHGRTVGERDRIVEIVEVLGPDGTPPYRARAENGHESIVTPGPDSVVDHRKGSGDRLLSPRKPVPQRYPAERVAAAETYWNRHDVVSHSPAVLRSTSPSGIGDCRADQATPKPPLSLSGGGDSLQTPPPTCP